MTLAAVVQLNCTVDEEANLGRAEELVREGAGMGAAIVATPENTNYLGVQQEKVRRAQSLDGPVCQRFSLLAKELGIHLLLGSFNEASPVAGKCSNTSVLFGPDGSMLAVYRKIHLFDIDLSEEVRSFESETVEPGAELTVCDIGFANLGLSICYDLRFGELYRGLRREGAHVIAVPAAFTLTTGRDHWELLLRARAVETQCYVVAPAQWGRHGDDSIRESYGHSMIVDPWGQVVASVGDGEGVAVARLEMSKVEKMRKSMPVEAHQRL